MSNAETVKETVGDTIEVVANKGNPYKKALWAGLGAAVVIGAGAAAYMLLRSSDETETTKGSETTDA